MVNPVIMVICVLLIKITGVSVSYVTDKRNQYINDKSAYLVVYCEAL